MATHDSYDESDTEYVGKYPSDYRFADYLRNFTIPTQDLNEAEPSNATCPADAVQTRRYNTIDSSSYVEEIDKSACNPCNSADILTNQEVSTTPFLAEIITNTQPQHSEHVVSDNQNMTRKRIKWTHEMNVNVINSFFLVNQCDDLPLPGWRPCLYKEFSKHYPELSVKISIQNLADRYRVIRKKPYLSETEIEDIRRKAGDCLSRREVIDQIAYTDTNSQADTGELFDNNTNSQKQASESQRSDYNLQDDSVYQNFLSTFNFFTLIDPLKRPRLPKIIFKRTTKYLIQKMNSVLGCFLNNCSSLSTLHDALYAAASCVLSENGQHPVDMDKVYHDVSSNRNESKPAWKTRLEKEISTLRSRRDLLITFLSGNRSERLQIKIRTILLSLNISFNSPNLEERLTEHADYLKQKYKAKGARLRRYNKTTKRKVQNKLFVVNEKLFYRLTLDSQQQNASLGSDINKDEFTTFWNDIWGKPVSADLSTAWLKSVSNSTSEIDDMNDIQITPEKLTKTLSKTSNWKSPGPDKIQNFWLKSFSNIHTPLANCFSAILLDPSKFPPYLCTGVTNLIYKNGDKNNPKNYRPITCLPTVYKLLTLVINNEIHSHCSDNKLISEYQKGCGKNSLGYKEQLIIDTIITKHAQAKQRDLYTCYIDYVKAFDSVPHNWLLKVLEIHKVNPKVILTLNYFMQHWKLSLHHSSQSLGNIKVQRGIFQGDSLSPTWFCLALNPLSKLLESSLLGYKIEKNNSFKFTHLLYMDDLKLFADTKRQLQSLVNTTKLFSNDIKMNFGLDKCATVFIKKGKVISSHEKIFDIQCLPIDQNYKYLGFNQHIGIDHSNMKNHFTSHFKQKLTKILKTSLDSKNLIKAINNYAVSSLIHTFGILKWSNTDLDSLDRLTRKMLSKFRNLHPNSAVERLYISRKQGGRGLLNIKKLCLNQINYMKKYFSSQCDTIIFKLLSLDKSFTPLKLAEINEYHSIHSENDDINSWQRKTLHGRYPTEIQKENIDKQMSLKFLTCGYLHSETEGFIIAIQDKVISTNNYKKHIIKSQSTDLCRKCHKPGETIEHITAGCPELANNAYLGRHNGIAAAVHQELAIREQLIEGYKPYYKYLPEAVIENSSRLLYWDRSIITDKPVPHNRPDIVYIDKLGRQGLLVDIAVPLTHNLEETEKFKIAKYQDLAEEMKRIWKLNVIKIIPLVISVEGVVTTNFKQNLALLGIPQNFCILLQKICLLDTCRIVRKFLNTD